MEYFARWDKNDPSIYQLLDEHLMGVAKLAKANASQLSFTATGELVGLLHDLGKYSDQFQSKRTNDIQVDHSTAGAQILFRSMLDLGTGPTQQAAAQLLALVVASHHSLVNCIELDGVDNFARRMEKSEIKCHTEQSLGRLPAGMDQLYRGLVPQALVEIGDFLKRVQRFDTASALIRKFKEGLLYRWVLSCLIDADHTNSADSVKSFLRAARQHGRYRAWPVLIKRLEAELVHFADKTASTPRGAAINAARRVVSDHCLAAATQERGIYCLAAATGLAKTLAGFRFALHHAEAHQLDRVFWFAPFNSITDQNADVIRRILEVHELFGTVVLEHHTNLTQEKNSWRSRLLSENWDAPVVCTSTAQFLNACFADSTRIIRRFHQLANSVLVFDEIQGLPLRCYHMFANVVNFLVECCGCSVVLCTATQPLLGEIDVDQQQRPRKPVNCFGAVRFAKEKDLVFREHGFPTHFQRVRIIDSRKAALWSREELANFALDLLREHGSCLVVVNTKKDAQTIFRLCHQVLPDATFHLSTNMCPAHRKHVLSLVKARLPNGPVLCVSTQLIEAGIDISFKSGARDYAGLDSIMQVEGRINRNGEWDSGCLHVINLWQSRSENIPVSIRLTRDAFYGTVGAPPARPVELRLARTHEENYWLRLFNSFCHRREGNGMLYLANIERGQHNLLEMLSTNPVGVVSKHYFQQCFKTAAELFRAIEDIQQGIVVPYGKEAEVIIEGLLAEEIQGKLLYQAQQYTIGVYPRNFEMLFRRAVIHPIGDTGIHYMDQTSYSMHYDADDHGCGLTIATDDDT